MKRVGMCKGVDQLEHLIAVNSCQVNSFSKQAEMLVHLRSKRINALEGKAS